MNHILRAWLRDNPLTADTSDFVAVPVINASLNVSDIIALLKQEGMEIKEETALDIITRFFRKAEEVILNGNSLNMGFVVARPMIKGVFKDKTWDKEKHSIYVNMTQGAELRKSIAKTKVEILGEQSSPMAIFTLVDTTNKTIPAARLPKARQRRLKVRTSRLRESIQTAVSTLPIWIPRQKPKCRRKTSPSMSLPACLFWFRTASLLATMN